MSTNDSLARLAQIIESRKLANGGNPDTSYVARLLHKGPNTFLKKIGEEAGEVIIAAKNQDISELKNEAADLIFHLLVTLRARGISFKDVERILEDRHSPAS